MIAWLLGGTDEGRKESWRWRWIVLVAQTTGHVRHGPIRAPGAHARLPRRMSWPILSGIIDWMKCLIRSQGAAPGFVKIQI